MVTINKYLKLADQNTLVNLINLINFFHTELTDPLRSITSFQNTTTIPIIKLPELKIYLARDCISCAGHNGGEDSLCFFFNRNVSSNPKPLGPSSPLQNTKIFPFQYF